MATFEKRYNRAGTLVAIRAKVRRAGSPHLSRTFKVAGGSEAAYARAMREAQRWVVGLNDSMANAGGATVPMPVAAPQGGQPVGGKTAARKPPAAGPSAAFAAQARSSAKDGAARIADGEIERLSAFAGETLSGLVRLQIEIGLAPHELAALRWQHIAFDTCSLSVVGASGAALRRVLLPPAAVELLLRMPGRKYGPVFAGLDANGMEASLRRAVRAAGLEKKFPWPVLVTLRREAALRWIERGLDRASVARVLGVADPNVVLQPPLPVARVARRSER